MKVFAIKHYVTDSWNAPPPTLMVIAKSYNNALEWINEEVAGNHNSGYSYRRGKSAEWWIYYGTFTVEEMEVY